MENCYICTESEGCKLSPCKCKDLYVHEECILKTIRKLNNTKCTICLSEYDNILSFKKIYYRINKDYYVLFILLLCISALSFCLKLIFSEDMNLDIISDVLIKIFVSFVFTTNLAILVLILTRIMRYKPPFWIKNMKIEAYFENNHI